MVAQLEAEIEQLKNKEMKNKSVQVSLLQSHSTMQTPSREIDADDSNMRGEASALGETQLQEEQIYIDINVDNDTEKQNEDNDEVDATAPLKAPSDEAPTGHRNRAGADTDIANSLQNTNQSINKIINRANEDYLEDQNDQMSASANDYEQVIEKQAKMSQQHHRNECLSLRQSSNN